jgi:hypothetical protein
MINRDTATALTLESIGPMSIADMISWAVAGYRVAQSMKQPVGHYIALLSDGYGLSPVLAEKVLRGEVSYCVEDGNVVLLLDQEDAEIYRSRQASIIGGDIPRQVKTNVSVATHH